MTYASCSICCISLRQKHQGQVCNAPGLDGICLQKSLLSISPFGDLYQLLYLMHFSETMTLRQSLQCPWPRCHLPAEVPHPSISPFDLMTYASCSICWVSLRQWHQGKVCNAPGLDGICLQKSLPRVYHHMVTYASCFICCISLRQWHQVKICNAPGLDVICLQKSLTW